MCQVEEFGFSSVMVQSVRLFLSASACYLYPQLGNCGHYHYAIRPPKYAFLRYSRLTFMSYIVLIIVLIVNNILS